jgi:hypothetical protein
MPLWRTFGILGLAALVSAAPAAVVYKWVDADGVVHFSDQPVPGAEKIVTSGSSSRGIMSQSAPSGAATQRPQKSAAPIATQQIAITSPQAGQTYSGEQQVQVNLSVEPALAPGQSITWTLNGSELSEPPNATQFTLPDLARGSYTLTATVTDAASGESRNADPVSFNVMRSSLLSPQHK